MKSIELIKDMRSKCILYDGCLIVEFDNGRKFCAENRIMC